MPLIILALITIILIEVPTLLRNKMWRELAVFCGFILIALVYGVIHTFELGILNPTDFTKMIFEPVFNVFDEMLK
ncbi:MAG: hypothetical protein ACOX2A_01665 [Tepidanaerobacteraceae bacterium]